MGITYTKCSFQFNGLEYAHNVSIDRDEHFRHSIQEIREWLKDVFGVLDELDDSVYVQFSTDFYFKEEEDALLFLLRWS